MSSLHEALLTVYPIWKANGLPFGRTFGNSFEALALTILREQDKDDGWRLVREPFVGLTENKPDYEELSAVDRLCGLEFKSVVISGVITTDCTIQHLVIRHYHSQYIVSYSCYHGKEICINL